MLKSVFSTIASEGYLLSSKISSAAPSELLKVQEKSAPVVKVPPDVAVLPKVTIPPVVKAPSVVKTSPVVNTPLEPINKEIKTDVKKSETKPKVKAPPIIKPEVKMPPIKKEVNKIVLPPSPVQKTKVPPPPPPPPPPPIKMK